MVLSSLFRIISRLLSGHGLGRNSYLAYVYLKVARAVLPRVIIYKGNKIYLDAPDSMSLSVFGRYSEEYELSLFESVINESSVVLDIGANIGIYTLTAAKHAYKVYSFEPDPISFSNLRRNIEANNYENVVPVNKAVSDKSGTAQFSSYSKFPLDRGNLHLLSGHEQENQEYRMIETVTLDEFFNDKPKKIDVIKMDIEGLEFEALKGMTSLINENHHIKIFLEFQPFALIRRGTDPGIFIDHIFSIFSHVYHIDETGRTAKPTNKEWLMNFAKNKEDGHFTNVLGVREVT